MKFLFLKEVFISFIFDKLHKIYFFKRDFGKVSYQFIFIELCDKIRVYIT